MPTTTVLAADSRRDLLVHDIPLATISGYAQLLLRRAARGGPELLALVDALQHIEEVARRVGDLLGELADMLQAGPELVGLGTPPAWNAPSPISSTTPSNTAATIARWW
jgi:hypothetical protein